MIRAILIFFLAVGLSLSVVGYYKRGRDIDAICKLIGPHDAIILDPKNPVEEVGNYCVALQDDW